MIVIKIPTIADVYHAIARWAYLNYARHAKASGVKPVGVPGNRDPENPCPAFEPRKRRIGDWPDCEADGHYLCAQCCHRAIADALEGMG